MKNSRSKLGYLAFLLALMCISTVDQVTQIGDTTVTIDLAAAPAGETSGTQNEISQLKKSNLTNEKAFIAHNFLCEL